MQIKTEGKTAYINVTKLEPMSLTDYEEFKKKLPAIRGSWWLKDKTDEVGNVWAVHGSGLLYKESVNFILKVRPALFYSSDEDIGNFTAAGYEWKTLRKGYAICKSDIGTCWFKKDYKIYNSSDYNMSDLRAFIEDFKDSIDI